MCDRVAILCRGRLVALDSPLALRQQHVETQGRCRPGRRALAMSSISTDDEARARLGRHVAAGEVASLQTREFNFHETFLKLTGMAFE